MTDPTAHELDEPRTKAGRAYVAWDNDAVEGSEIEQIIGKHHWQTVDAVLAIEQEAARLQGDPGLLREALAGLIEPFRRLHDDSVDMTNFMHRAGEDPNGCANCRLLNAARSALAATPAGPEAIDVEFDPEPRWKPGEHDDLRVFVSQAARRMFVRLREKSGAWGRSWRTGYYSDSENMDRLQRAVAHLDMAVDIAHRDDAGPAEMAEPWKRAADVANQAFMFADPMRGWSEDAAHRAARPSNPAQRETP